MHNETGLLEVRAPRTRGPRVVVRRVRAFAMFVIAMLGLSMTSGLGAQDLPTPAADPLIKLGGSPNVQLLSHLPLEGFFYNGGIDIEQEMSRPYAYVPLWLDKAGFVVIDLSDPETPEIIYRWEIENGERYSWPGCGVPPPALSPTAILANTPSKVGVESDTDPPKTR